jgi:hypothetical protein
MSAESRKLINQRRRINRPGAKNRVRDFYRLAFIFILAYLISLLLLKEL